MPFPLGNCLNYLFYLPLFVQHKRKRKPTTLSFHLFLITKNLTESLLITFLNNNYNAINHLTENLYAKGFLFFIDMIPKVFNSQLISLA